MSTFSWNGDIKDVSTRFVISKLLSESRISSVRKLSNIPLSVILVWARGEKGDPPFLPRGLEKGAEHLKEARTVGFYYRSELRAVCGLSLAGGGIASYISWQMLVTRCRCFHDFSFIRVDFFKYWTFF